MRYASEFPTRCWAQTSLHDKGRTQPTGWISPQQTTQENEGCYWWSPLPRVVVDINVFAVVIVAAPLLLLFYPEVIPIVFPLFQHLNSKDLPGIFPTGSATQSGPLQRKTKGGNSGEGKKNHKTPPQKRFWTRPPMIRFPLPLFTPCSFLWRKRAQTRRIPFSEASKTGFGGGTLCYVSPPPPPQNSHDTFCRPLATSQRFPEKWGPRFGKLWSWSETPVCS